LAQERGAIQLFLKGENLVEDLKKDPSFDIIVTNLLIPEVNGLQVPEKSKKRNPGGVVIIMT